MGAAPAKKAKKPAKKAEHPTYDAMISAAIGGLKEKSGSSRKAILKYILANYKVGDNKEKVQNRVRLAVKRMAAAKKLVPGRAKGKGAGCFKLAEKPKKAKKVKKPKKKAAKKVKKAKKPKAKKAKKPAAKKAPKKKAAPKKKPAKKAAKKA